MPAVWWCPFVFLVHRVATSSSVLNARVKRTPSTFLLSAYTSPRVHRHDTIVVGRYTSNVFRRRETVVRGSSPQSKRDSRVYIKLVRTRVLVHVYTTEPIVPDILFNGNSSDHYRMNTTCCYTCMYVRVAIRPGDTPGTCHRFITSVVPLDYPKVPRLIVNKIS